MPSRFGSPRGSIPRILREAGEIADARMRSVQRYLDDFTAADDPTDQVGGGARLSRQDFVALLRQSPDFRQQVANRWVFASAKERDALLGVLRDAFPSEMSQAVAGQPTPGTQPGGIPPEQQGTGMGGPPQGASPVGPQPQPGMAPPGPPGAPPVGPPPAPGPAPMPGAPIPTQPAGPVLGAPLPAVPPAGPPGVPLGPAPSGPMGAPPQPLGLPVGPGGQGLPLLPPVPNIGPAVGPPGPPRPSLAAGLV